VLILRSLESTVVTGQFVYWTVRLHVGQFAYWLGLGLGIVYNVGELSSRWIVHEPVLHSA